MVLITTLHNKTGSKIILREGQGGVLRTISPHLEADRSMTVQTNESATYKEYWCAVQTNNEKVILTSDDCIEWLEIQIVPTAGPAKSFEWKGTVPRHPSKQPPAAPVTPAQAAAPGQPAADASGRGFSLKQWVRGLFSN